MDFSTLTWRVFSRWKHAGTFPNGLISLTSRNRTSWLVSGCARAFWHCVAPPPPTTAEVAVESHGGSAQQSGRRERQRDSWRWRRIRWARTSRLEPESSRNGSRSPWIEPRRRWARGDPLFKKVSLSPRNFLTVPESHCHGSVKLWDGHIELVLLSCSVLRAGKASMREGERPWHHVPTMTGFWNRVSLLSRVIGWKKSPTDFTFVISVCVCERTARLHHCRLFSCVSLHGL